MRENKPVKIIIHHTAVSRKRQPKQFLAVNRYHQQAFGSYCLSDMAYFGGYHIFIEADGTEYRYRNDNEEGCHTKGQNIDSLGVCLAGHFDQELPTEAQIITLKKRLKKWNEKYKIRRVLTFPHREFSQKTCYGSNLDDNWGRKLLLEVEKSDREKEMADMQFKLDTMRRILLRLQIWLRRMSK